MGQMRQRLSCNSRFRHQAYVNKVDFDVRRDVRLRGELPVRVSQSSLTTLGGEGVPPGGVTCPDAQVEEGGSLRRHPRLQHYHSCQLIVTVASLGGPPDLIPRKKAPMSSLIYLEIIPR